MKVEILSFSRNLDIEFFLDWIYEVEKFFDMAYVLAEKQVKLVVYKLKGGDGMVRPIANHKKTSRQAKRNDKVAHEIITMR